MPTYKPFRRSTRDRMAFGVAGGVAIYLEVDPVLIRVLFVIACVATAGVALLVYVAMAVLMPESTAEDSQGSTAEPGDGGSPGRARTERKGALAVILICIGAFMLFANVGWSLFGSVGIGAMWAVAFIVLGLYLLSRRPSDAHE